MTTDLESRIDAILAARPALLVVEVDLFFGWPGMERLLGAHSRRAAIWADKLRRRIVVASNQSGLSHRLGGRDVVRGYFALRDGDRRKASGPQVAAVGARRVDRSVDAGCSTRRARLKLMLRLPLGCGRFGFRSGCPSSLAAQSIPTA